MALHSFSQCLVHLVWCTKWRRRVLFGDAAARVAAVLRSIAASKEIRMLAVYVNPEHVHALVELPTTMSLEDLVRYLKGGSSHWINQHGLVSGRFAWGRGYGAFSVSYLQRMRVVEYIRNQEVHHRVRTFQAEYDSFERQQTGRDTVEARRSNRPGDMGRDGGAFP